MLTDYADKPYTSAARRLLRNIQRAAWRLWCRYLILRCRYVIVGAEHELRILNAHERAIPKLITREIERIADAKICIDQARGYLQK